jgi:hypothetical protein
MMTTDCSSGVSSPNPLNSDAEESESAEIVPCVLLPMLPALLPLQAPLLLLELLLILYLLLALMMAVVGGFRRVVSLSTSLRVRNTLSKQHYEISVMAISAPTMLKI